jgi:hypothetical protein
MNRYRVLYLASQTVSLAARVACRMCAFYDDLIIARSHCGVRKGEERNVVKNMTSPEFELFWHDLDNDRPFQAFISPRLV